MQPFDPVSIGLDGYALVEASAGTGKTYGITSLYLRLIMELGLMPSQILVVTYTKAATEELKQKIRARINEALEFLDTGRIPPFDTFLEPLAIRLQARGVRKETMRQRLEDALLRQDEAAVFTIHGFCQRMLKEFAFEAVSPLDREVIHSEDELYRQAMQEFIRKVLYSRNIAEISFLEMVVQYFGTGGIAGSFFEKVRPLAALPMPEILPEITISEAIAEHRELESRLARLRAISRDHGGSLKKAAAEFYNHAIEIYLRPVSESPELSNSFPVSAMRDAMTGRFKRKLGQQYKSLSSPGVFQIAKESDRPFLFHLSGIRDGSNMRYLADGILSSRKQALKAVGRRRLEGLLASLDKQWSMVPFSEFWQDLSPMLENPMFMELNVLLESHNGMEARFLAVMVREARDFATEYVREKKRLLSQISYDDMLVMMEKALRGKGKAMLAREIRSRFAAALVDEFQDTDAIQWKIFSSIYPDSRRSMLYLIGDPKQAIYGFRGADIFTYLQARREVPRSRQFSLATNWRSNPELIGAVNTIFGQEEKRVFVLDGIEYSRVKPKRAGHEWIEIDGEGRAAVEMWVPDPEEESVQDGDKIRDREASPQLLAALEIQRLIELGKKGRAVISMDGEAVDNVSSGHIAVLVRDFMEAGKVKGELERLGIPSIYYGASSVFKTREAVEMLYILHGVAHPSDAFAITTALATVSMGFQAGDILSIKEDQDKWGQMVEEFSMLKALWQRRGVFPMLRVLFNRFGIPERLLRLKGGERLLTNMRQLSELLAQAGEEHPGIERLILWLKENIDSPDERSESQQLRLETDEDIVKIMTYHRSKGLEFPVVFMPFIDQCICRPRDIFYDKDKGCYAVRFADLRMPYDKCEAMLKETVRAMQNNDLPCQPGPDENGFNQSEIEARAETARLLYVGITRARSRLYLCMEGEAGAFSSLISTTGESEDEFSAEDAMGILADADGVRCMTYSEKIAQLKQFESVRHAYRPESFSLRPVQRITRSPLAPWRWCQTSFSALAASEGIHDQGPVLLAGIQQEDQDLSAPGMDIFSFPRGALAGNCMHRLLELLDFQADEAEMRRQAVSVLAQHGFQKDWADVLAGMAHRVVNSDIGQGIRLRQIERCWMAKEMNFFLKFSRQELQACSGLPEEVRGGVIKGFIDLAFRHGDNLYVLDYKSNWLGPGPEYYSQETMREAMDSHNYWLQAAIYLRALEAFLRQNRAAVPRAKIAGAFYLFLRGVGHTDETERCGVLFLSPEELDARYPGLGLRGL